MLVLTRRAGESILLPGSDVIISVQSVHGDRAALGITSPSLVKIYRHEIWNRIQGEQAPLITPSTALSPAPRLPK